MHRFIESIKLLDGQFYNLSLHQQRMEHTMLNFFGDGNFIDLKAFLKQCEVPPNGLFKCRLVYQETVKQVTFLPYAIKPIQSLRVVESNSATYPFKFEKRDQLDGLYARREQCDDIIIIRNKLVTDSSFANLAFKRGGQWFTPDTCLLNGVMRQHLLVQGKILCEPITVNDIQKFEKVKLINALLGFEGPEIMTAKIIF